MPFSLTTEVDAPPAVVFAVLSEVERCHSAPTANDEPKVLTIEPASGGLLFATGLRLPTPGIAEKVMQFSADGWVFVSAVALLRSRRAGA